METELFLISQKEMYLCCMQKEWFADWFDTPYYHILYKNRDQGEAERFIDKLVKFLKIPKGTELLDLACGRGRHSVTLAKYGYLVTGVDLSENSIQTAKKSAFGNPLVHFEVRDMRFPFETEKFHGIFNLFTSFGYFDDIQDNRKVIHSAHQMLKESGLIVIDFMNVQRVIHELIQTELKTVDDIDFYISRKFDGTHITKEISFFADEKNFSFSERVQALGMDDFSVLLEQSGFQIMDTFGNFDLAPFEAETSDRLIIIAKKI